MYSPSSKWTRLLGAAASLGLFGALLNGVPTVATEVERETSAPANTAVEEITATEVELIRLSEIEPNSDILDNTDGYEKEIAQRAAAADVVEEARQEAGAAHFDLNSDIAIVGLTWDISRVDPERLETRWLEDGTWSEWRTLEQEDPAEANETREQGFTEAIVLTNVMTVEVLAFGVEQEKIGDIQINVIDPRAAAPVENQFDVAQDAEEGSSEPVVDTQGTGADQEVVGEKLGQAEPVDDTAQIGSSESSGEAENELQDMGGAVVGENASFLGSRQASLSANGAQWVTGKNGLVVTTRAGWGAKEADRKGFVDKNVTYKGAVIHHTAGNNDYSQAQVPGILRGIYYYHAVSLDWGDIGYHILVDKYGGVWEGRYGTLTQSPRGAHAYGGNSDTFGISVIGDYSTKGIEAAAENSVAKAIAWYFGVHNIKSATGTIYVPGADNKGRNVNVISGHRDISATSCPGRIYNNLPSIRTKTAAYMAPTPSFTPQTVKFQPDNIMSDAAFYNPNTMTETQIQTFLNTAGASCSPSGTATCLKNTRFPTQNLTTIRGGCQPLRLSGNQSAAKIIHETSRACGLNPQVILATIQKEQSGIVQPRTPEVWAKAMGSGCPTGQSCDAAQAGFTKQVYYGADKLVSYKRDSSWGYISAYQKGTTVTIPNNVDSKCGTQSFKMANYATASLYMYTPYVGASTVSGCQAVGAKSFWNIMNRWFPESIEQGVVKNQWVLQGGTWYRVGASGQLLYGWFLDEATWYYLNPSSGAMQTGWVKLGSTWYYLDGSGAMQTGWVKLGSTWYYLDGSGAMQTGWVKLGSTWYYLGGSGAMQTGWISSGGSWFYSNKNGAMVTGTQTIDGRISTFASNGTWLGYGYRFGMSWAAQQTNYWCGPASGYSILARLGYGRSASGVALSQGALASNSYMETDRYERTAFDRSMFAHGLNRWMGRTVYQQKRAPSTTFFRSAVTNSFTSKGVPVAVDTQEWASGPHYNNHPRVTFSHIMPVEGYDPATDTLTMIDPASFYYYGYGARNVFTHHLPSFTGFLQDFGIYY